MGSQFKLDPEVPPKHIWAGGSEISRCTETWYTYVQHGVISLKLLGSIHLGTRAAEPRCSRISNDRNLRRKPPANNGISILGQIYGVSGLRLDECLHYRLTSLV